MSRLGRWLWKRGVDRASAKGAMGNERSLFAASRNHLRFEEAGRYLDIYFEDCGDELVIDAASIRSWHVNRYSSPIEVLLEQNYQEACTPGERDRILQIVIQELARRHPGSLITTRGSDDGVSEKGGEDN
jgi:hypothetical protein